MTIENRPDTYKVTLLEDDDGSSKEISYTIRGLSENEIGPWSEFCASVFAYKDNPPPPSYFARHYKNDPHRGGASLIRVAFFNGAMVASCRLFLRTISMGNTNTRTGAGTVTAGGIGEVGTSNDHRRRGLSKVLLQNVIEIIKERKLQVSLLHAAPAFFPVYKKAGGYVGSKSRWSVVNINVTTTTSQQQLDQNNNAEGYSIREASFPQDTERLAKLHQLYSEQRFAGCIVRSLEYWNTYLSQELKGSLWILVQEEMIVAWLSVRPRGERFQLREFGLDETLIATSMALRLLLSRANITAESPSSFALVLPTVVLDQVDQTDDSFLDWSTETSEDDWGWMYKILDDQIQIDSINGSERPHLIWPADSF
jgi:hypothetical protein